MKEKKPTGITGLDIMLKGGIPEGNQIIVEGGPGVGKTLLGFEFLYRGAEKGENGILFSFEEDNISIIENAKAAFTSFNQIDSFLEQGKLTILGSEDTKQYIQKNKDSTAYSFGSFISELDSLIQTHGAKRIVIDSISVIRLFIPNLLDYRYLSTSLSSVLKRKNLISFLIQEKITLKKSNTIFQPESFIYDGLISLFFTGNDIDNRIPMLEIIKMRGTEHTYPAVPYEIIDTGFNLLLSNRFDTTKK
ncbi:MAG: ATPase domain-containing protein [Candidatus Micrarchaeaceae archaeon]